MLYNIIRKDTYKPSVSMKSNERISMIEPKFISARNHSCYNASAAVSLLVGSLCSSCMVSAFASGVILYHNSSG